MKENTNLNEVEQLVSKGQEALRKFMETDQATIDKIVYEMTKAGLEAHLELAKLAFDETGRGVVEDKVIKNMFATEYIYHSIKREKTVGIIERNELEGYFEIAEPVGIVAGVTPVTNPTSTTLFKALICTKTRNPVIFAFHPGAQKSSARAAQIVYEAGLKAGAPENFIQWIKTPSIEATNALMNDPGVSLILATGGAGMVKAAYSCGKPALGVGPGNVPCYINEDVDVERACYDLVLSKSFDNGMICASEQAVIVDQSISKEFERIMTKNLCYFTDEAETVLLTDYMFPLPARKLRNEIVGKSAYEIAKNAGIEVGLRTKVLVAKLPFPDVKHPLSLEKLSPVLAYFTAKNSEEAFAYAVKMLELGGLGHSAVIHSNNKVLCRKYAEVVKVGRVIMNQPSSQGAIGDIYNTTTPSLTLGCGSYGSNSTTSNVSSVNLINRKRVSERRVNMQWFKIPPKIYFEENAIQYLEKMPNISRAFIVTDETMVKLGYIDKVLYYLRKRPVPVHSEIFSEVEPDPSVETIMRGVRSMNAFKPDVIIAIGGGSPIDAAKGMWLFYENPESNFDDLKLRFLDIRKRTVHYPNLGKKTQFVAVPTTSGTGSEVTSFSVITDKQNGNIKYPLADYELTPDVAIIDPQFVRTMPKTIVADTGLDVLTHAIEAYVSIMASDYTDGLALKAIELIFKYLKRSYLDPHDTIAREKVHNASCIAGMAFSNAFLGINHSLAHKLGGEFGVAHGRANALVLPHVIAYNAQMPSKFPAFPKYQKFVADERYAQIARYLNLGGTTKEEQILNLIKAIENLRRDLDVEDSIQKWGVDEVEFLNKVSLLSERAFEDQCTTANPRYPLISEIEQIYKNAYYGVEINKKSFA